MDIGSFLLGLAPTIITGMGIFYWQRGQKRRDAVTDERASARKRESLLALELQMATAKLSYAVAVAVKRGTPNGEVEEGVKAYEDARKKYLSFLNEQATEHLLNY